MEKDAVWEMLKDFMEEVASELGSGKGVESKSGRVLDHEGSTVKDTEAGEGRRTWG